MVTLCNFCNRANGNVFSSGPCFICGNSFDKLEMMLSDGVKKISSSEVSSFAISTKIPNIWLLREEVVWNEVFRRPESIKNSVNRQIVKTLVKETEKKYSPETGEIRIVFDFSSSSVKIENESLFIFGRYKKFSRELSQSRWMCKKCEGEGCFKCD